ncbi:hypothetical protein PIB30_050334 [Stylosanthes scabra]|uniref:Uncharacterized protein n=1 Tax=Stylosanthes scabra TaxID=79078 RepID=A0ABU6UJ27_9FABA|nr:hypothetical protein [Stylosanthes scabra]
MMMILMHNSLPSQTLFLTQLIILCWRVRRRTLRWRRQPQPRLVVYTPVGMEVTAGITYGRAPQRFHGYTTITTDGMSLSSVRLRSTWSSFGGTVGGLQRGYELKIYESWQQRASKRLRELFHEIRLVEFWRLLRWDEHPRLMRCLRGLTPARKIVSGWTSSHITERAPPIDEEAIWLQIASGRKNERIYGKGVVPVYFVPLIIGDVDDTDTASSPPDMREQVTLLNRELSQQAEANRQRISCVHRHASPTASAAATTALARSPSPPSQQDRVASPSQHDDDLDYV